ncbi:hypothetical protein N7512_010091 [Penicillium capsulatum]|nr:hypothetical protein N7512_010091 [Penicillium capsulatum]
MSALLKSYLGFGEVAGIKSSDDSVLQKPLPAAWYTSQGMFDLERRAVFSRKWLLTSHKLRLPNTGDYLKYEIAGYSFILVKDRKGDINAFHNVCRHRAFPVVTDDGGTARIFSCKYHGWSYGLNGNLAKAPGYQDLDGFDKSQNGLFPIHVHVDGNGFVWVNLDSADQPETAWEDDFRGVDLQSPFQDFDLEQYTFDHAWEEEGAYNWKILADSYSQGAQSPVASSEVPSLAELGISEDKNATAAQYAHAKPEEVVEGLKVSSTYYFPNASLTVSPHFFFLQRLVPTSPLGCAMRFEVYRHRDASDADFELINLLYKRIMSEDKDLGTNQEPLDFQAAVRALVTKHQMREEQAGREIWPARQTLPATAATSQEDIDFCSKLTSQSQAKADCSSQAGGCCGGVACSSGNEALAY